MDPEIKGAGSRRRRKRRQRAVELMQDFAENSSLHGLKYMSERGRSLVEKIFWVATFLVSISLCVILIRNVWIKWQTSPVIVALSEHLVSVGEVPFPSVTICPQIKAKRTVYNFTHETLEMKKRFDALRGNLSQDDDEDDLTPVELLEAVKNAELSCTFLAIVRIEYDPLKDKYEDVGLICWVESPMIDYNVRNYSDATAIQNIIEVSPTIDDVLRGCRWREKIVNCEDMFSPVLTTEGLCFTMNSLAASEIFRQENIQRDYYYLNSSKPSTNWSLQDGYANSEDNVYPKKGRGNGAYPDMMVILKEQQINQDGLCYGINHGYKVYLQHPADMPQSSLYYYAALPGQTSSFALKFSVTNTSHSLMTYPPEIRQCYFPEERHLKYFRTYTPKNCRLECLSEYTFESCGCVWFHMPRFWSPTSGMLMAEEERNASLSILEPCSKIGFKYFHRAFFLDKDSTTICRERKRKCVINAMERYGIEESQTNSKVDRCKCLPSCSGIQYDAEVLKTKFDIHSFLNAVKLIHPEWYPNGTDQDDGYLFTNIELYYKESRYVAMRRSELFGLTDFLANCGGLLGLFLGFSFLSLIEIFYFLTLRLGCTLRRDIRRDNGVKQN